MTQIRIAAPNALTENEVTDKSIYLARREFIRRAAILCGGWGIGMFSPGCSSAGDSESALETSPQDALKAIANTNFSTDEEATSYKDATSYNNFYEFGTDKSDPARYAGSLKTRPWTITVEGAVNKPGMISIEDILSGFSQEERIYRLRCVEAWSMVIPWVGIPLGDLLKRFEPTSAAKFVEFRTLHDPEQMPGQERRVIEWPYREGLRIDEAMNPLAILATGMYGQDTAEPERSSLATRLALEVWFQEYQIDCLNTSPRLTTSDQLECIRATRIRLLRQRKPCR